MVEFFLDYIKTKRRAEDFTTDAEDENEAECAGVEVHDGTAEEDDGKTETPFHIKIVLEVNFTDQGLISNVGERT